MKPVIIIAAVVFAACRLSSQTMEVTSSGVGIGTSTPAHKLEIVGTPANFVQDAIRISSGTTDNVSGFRMTGGTSGTADIVRIANTDGTVYAGWLNLYRDGTSKVQITASAGYPTYFSSGGNVGIDTTNPGKKLEVVGDIVGRDSSISGGQAVDIQAASDGAHFWVNNSYDPASSGSGWVQAMTLKASGYVGIGTTTPGYLLTVNGPVRASQFIADVNTYSDFVFKPGYKLASLAEVETAIERNGHLPGIPSEAEVKEHGVDLASQQTKLLQKVEELTLYVIELEKRTDALEQENKRLKIGTRPSP